MFVVLEEIGTVPTHGLDLKTIDRSVATTLDRRECPTHAIRCFFQADLVVLVRVQRGMDGLCATPGWRKGIRLRNNGVRLRGNGDFRR